MFINLKIIIGKDVITFREFIKKHRITIFYIVKTADYYFRVILSKVSPYIATHLLFFRVFKKKLDLKNPKSLNEKLMWLKLNSYYENPLITQCADKLEVRDYVKERGLSKILNDLIGVYNDINEIPWRELPNQFVIKCNHGSGYNIICDNKNNLNIEKTINKLKRWMKEDYYLQFAELQYKFIKKRIIVENYLGNSIIAYKYFCFNGVPKIILISKNIGHKKDIYVDFYGINWNQLNFKSSDHDLNPNMYYKPSNLNEMIEISKVLSNDFPFVRVDLFNVNSKIFFSELTFIPTGGLMRFDPSEVDNWLGSLLVDLK